MRRWLGDPGATAGMAGEGRGFPSCRPPALNAVRRDNPALMRASPAKASPMLSPRSVHAPAQRAIFAREWGACIHRTQEKRTGGGAGIGAANPTFARARVERPSPLRSSAGRRVPTFARARGWNALSTARFAVSTALHLRARARVEPAVLRHSLPKAFKPNICARARGWKSPVAVIPAASEAAGLYICARGRRRPPRPAAAGAGRPKFARARGEEGERRQAHRR